MFFHVCLKQIDNIFAIYFDLETNKTYFLANNIKSLFISTLDNASLSKLKQKILPSMSYFYFLVLDKGWKNSSIVQ